MAKGGWIRVRGIPEVQAKLRQFGKDLQRIVRAALREEGERIMLEAKMQTPVDTGALRASGRVEGPELQSGGRLVATLSFGGPAGAEKGGVFVGYALYVHENLTAHHKVGNAKFLELPARRAAPGMADRIAARVHEAGY